MIRTFILVFFCSLLIFNFSYGAIENRLKVIIDTDAGTDDAVGIFLALRVSEVEVIAITTTYGNTAEKNVETNILKILTVSNRTDIPVYAGATRPFIEDYHVVDFMGSDGFGDAEFDRPILGNIDRSMSAAEAMVDLAKKYPGQINVLTLGPLTNIATAANIDASFTRNVKRFYSMGTKFNFPESSHCKKDFNYGHDPEANRVFFTSPVRFKTFILSSDILRKRRSISKEWRINSLGRLDSDIVHFLNKIEEKILQKLDYWADADSLTTALMIWPELLLDSFDAYIDAVIDGPHRGQVIVYPHSENDSHVINAQLAKDFNVEGFENKLLQYLA